MVERPPRRTVARKAELQPVLEYAGPGRDGQTIEGQSRLVHFVNLVKLPHTVFALPFALVGVVYGSFVGRVTPAKVGLVLLAFTAARFAAMAFNRVADLRFDVENPRTRNRELPRGVVSVRQAGIAVAVASAIFFAAAGLLNPLCLALAPLALMWVLAYSYTKRFTHWSHLWLGLSLGIAPVGGYLAITGAWSEPAWPLLVLVLAVLSWVGGFDMFYALQDEQFDREHGLRSAVVLLGVRRSILTAKTLHGMTIVALVLFGMGTDFGWLYFGGVLVAAGILAWEHRLVRPQDLSRVDAAFFTMNGVMSIVIFLGALGGRWL